VHFTDASRFRYPVFPRRSAGFEALVGHDALWHGSKGTPKAIITKLNTAVVAALADPAAQAKMAELGQEIYPRARQTPEAFGALQRAEIENGGRSSRPRTSNCNKPPRPPEG
jgi:tripartite-type tricarboxylate transporter receptor subunit TctC